MATKTTFILHGGFATGKKQQNDLFFQEMLKMAPAEANILLVYFAEVDDKVGLRTQQDTEEFNANRGTKVLRFKVASEKTFAEDCAWADVIYLHGGKTVKITEALSKYPDIARILSGRTIAGDSAGAKALCAFFYSEKSGAIGKGLGILPFKFAAHHKDGAPDPFAEVKPESQVESGLETVLLHEYEMKAVER